MNFGEAHYALSHCLKTRLISYTNPLNMNEIYQFRKKSQRLGQDGIPKEYWTCLECEKILKRRGREENEFYCTILVSNGLILKNPVEGHHSDCEYRNFGAVGALQLDREARLKCAKGQKRPMEAHVDMNSEINRRFQDVEQNAAVEQNLPDYKQMKSGLRRWFQKGRVPVPDPFELPIEYCSTERGRFADPGTEHHGERWLLCSNRDEKVLAFCSDLDLNVIAQSSALIMDGTFKVAPNDFVQLYTIHAWGNFQFEAMPVCHALMQSKTVAAYVYLFSQIRQKLLQNHGGIGNLVAIHMDFEIAAHNAARQVFPELSIRGCLFHFSQALNRRLNNLGMRNIWTEEGAIGEWIGCCKALALLPVPLVVPAYDVILRNIPQIDDALRAAKLEEFRIYFHTTWIYSQQFPLAIWNHWSNTGPRTTNHAEGYHNRLNLAEVREAHLAIRNFLHLLQPLHNRDQIRIRNLSTHVYQPKNRDQTYEQLDLRIATAKARFYERTGNLWDFPNFDIQQMPAHGFQFLMNEIHNFLRFMRHCIGKKARVVIYNE